MNEKELRKIWNAALENFENNANNYFEKEREVVVNDVTLLFNVDIDNAIHYTTISKSMDDLIYVKEHPEEHNVKEVLHSFEQFKNRVENFANSVTY